MKAKMDTNYSPVHQGDLTKKWQLIRLDAKKRGQIVPEESTMNGSSKLLSRSSSIAEIPGGTQYP